MMQVAVIKRVASHFFGEATYSVHYQKTIGLLIIIVIIIVIIVVVIIVIAATAATV